MQKKIWVLFGIFVSVFVLGINYTHAVDEFKIFAAVPLKNPLRVGEAQSVVVKVTNIRIKDTAAKSFSILVLDDEVGIYGANWGNVLKSVPIPALGKSETYTVTNFYASNLTALGNHKFTVEVRLQSGFGDKLESKFTPINFDVAPAEIIPLVNVKPIGYFDSLSYVNNNLIAKGWTCDADSYATALTVRFSKTELSDVSHKIVEDVVAGGTREGAVGELCGGNTKHGFEVNLGKEVKQGSNIYAYVKNGNDFVTLPHKRYSHPSGDPSEKFITAPLNPNISVVGVVNKIAPNPKNAQKVSLSTDEVVFDGATSVAVKVSVSSKTKSTFVPFDLTFKLTNQAKKIVKAFEPQKITKAESVVYLDLKDPNFDRVTKYLDTDRYTINAYDSQGKLLSLTKFAYGMIVSPKPNQKIVGGTSIPIRFNRNLKDKEKVYVILETPSGLPFPNELPIQNLIIPVFGKEKANTAVFKVPTGAFWKIPGIESTINVPAGNYDLLFQFDNEAFGDFDVRVPIEIVYKTSFFKTVGTGVSASVVGGFSNLWEGVTSVFR